MEVNYGIHELGNTKVANVAVCDERYILCQAPLKIEINSI